MLPPTLGPMRIVHTSDWHLGRSLHGADLSDAHQAYFDHLVELVVAESVDAVLVSGDIYDRALPPVGSVALLDDVLCRLAAHTRVILTPGNHDSAPRLGFASRLYQDRVRIVAQLCQSWQPVVINGFDGQLVVYGIPYLEPDAVRHQLAEDPQQVPARSHQAVISAVTARIGMDVAQRRQFSDCRAIAMAHCFVAPGGVAAEPVRSESERDIRVGGLDVVARSTFDGIGLDYVALGHLHHGQVIGGGPTAIRYSGSPVAFSFSEVGHRKSTVLLDLTAGTTETIDAPVLRPIGLVRGDLAQLCSSSYDSVADHYLSVTVTDNVRPEAMVSTIRKRFAHALVIMHEPAIPVATPVGIARAVTDPVEVLADFVTQVGGSPPTPPESAVLLDAYEHVNAAAQGA